MKAIIAILLIVSCQCVSAVAAEMENQHPAGPPGDTKIILENESVRVLRIRIATGEKTPMHDVTPRIVVWLGDARFVDSFPDGTRREEIRKRGDAEWVPARRHAGENVGETPMDFIAVVLKPSGAATRRPH
jgi:beta-alanine degradation protein BauB